MTIISENDFDIEEYTHCDKNIGRVIGLYKESYIKDAYKHINKKYDVYIKSKRSLKDQCIEKSEE